MVLEFKVSGQTLRKVPLETPVVNSIGYLKAHFTLPSEYTGTITVNFGKYINHTFVSVPVPLDKTTYTCNVPEDILASENGKEIEMYVSLSSTDVNSHIPTNRVIVKVEASGEGLETFPMPGTTVNQYQETVRMYDEIIEKNEETKELIVKTPYVGGNGNWFEYDVLTGAYVDSLKPSKGESVKGDNGLSAYQVWLSQGNTGTEADFLNSLKTQQDVIDGINTKLNNLTNQSAITGFKVVTNDEYTALPSTKLTDGIIYLIKG